MRAALVLAAAVALWLGAAATLKAETARPEASPLAAFIEHYYQAPRPREAVDRLAGLDVPAFLADAGSAEETHGLALLTVFYAHILHRDPPLALRLAERLAAARRPDNALIGALAIANAATAKTAPALALIERSGLLAADALQTIRATTPYPFPALRAQSHLDIDLFWVSFFATGDTAYLAKIVDALAWYDAAAAAAAPHRDPGQLDSAARQALRRQLTAISAYGSLAVHARSHPAVLAALEGFARGRTDQTGAILNAIVAAARRPQ